MKNKNNKNEIVIENIFLHQNLDVIKFFILNDKNTDLRKSIDDLHNADIADVIQNLDFDIRNKFISKVKSYFDPEILTYLSESIREDIIAKLDIKQLASNSGQLEVDDAVDVIEDLEESDKNVFLDNIGEDDRKLIKEGLNYPEDSAGRLMQRKFVSINISCNVGEAIDYLRKNTNELPDDFYEIYLVDDGNKILGIVPLGRLMGSKRSVMMHDIKNKITRTIDVFLDQEEVAYQFNKYAMVSAPVINNNNEIIGSITVDDVVDVIEEEREEDILKLGGVGQGDIYETVIDTTRSRFSWLFVNLLTAVVASIVISFFQDFCSYKTCLILKFHFCLTWTKK